MSDPWFNSHNNNKPVPGASSVLAQPTCYNRFSLTREWNVTTGKCTVLTFHIQDEIWLHLAVDPAIGLHAPELTVDILIKGQPQLGARRDEAADDRQAAVFRYLLGKQQSVSAHAPVSQTDV